MRRLAPTRREVPAWIRLLGLLGVVVLVPIGLAIGAGAGQDSSLKADLERLAELARSHLFARAPKWRCDIAVRYICSPQGCQAGTEWKGWIIVDAKRQTYERCDARWCDPYPLQQATGGIYTTASVGAARAMYLKVLNDGSEFLESVSLGTSSHSNFGACAPAE